MFEDLLSIFKTKDVQRLKEFLKKHPSYLKQMFYSPVNAQNDIFYEYNSECLTVRAVPLLHFAVRTRYRSLEIIQCLIDNNYCNINELDSWERTLFECCWLYSKNNPQDIKIFHYLFFHPSLVLCARRYSWTREKYVTPFMDCIHPTANHFSPEPLEFYLQHGVPIYQEDLSQADQYRKTEVYKTLANAYMLLQDAKADNNNKIMNSIDHLKKNLNAYCPETKNTALHFAIKNKNFWMMKQLIDAGASLEIRNKNLESPLDLLFGSKDPAIPNSNVKKGFGCAVARVLTHFGYTDGQFSCVTDQKSGKEVQDATAESACTTCASITWGVHSIHVQEVVGYGEDNDKFYPMSFFQNQILVWYHPIEAQKSPYKTVAKPHSEFYPKDGYINLQWCGNHKQMCVTKPTWGERPCEMARPINSKVSSGEKTLVYYGCYAHLRTMKTLLNNESLDANKKEINALFKVIFDVIDGKHKPEQYRNQERKRLKRELEAKEIKDLKDNKEVKEVKELKETKENNDGVSLLEVHRNILCEALSALVLNEKSYLFNLELAYALLLKISPVDLSLENKIRFQKAQKSIFVMLNSGKLSTLPEFKNEKAVLRAKIKAYYQSSLEDNAPLRKMILEYTECGALPGISHCARSEHINFILGLLDEILSKTLKYKNKQADNKNATTQIVLTPQYLAAPTQHLKLEGPDAVGWVQGHSDELLDTALHFLLTAQSTTFIYETCLKYLNNINKLLENESVDAHKRQAKMLLKVVLNVIKLNDTWNNSENNDIKGLMITLETKEHKEQKEGKERKEALELKDNRAQSLLLNAQRDGLCEKLGEILLKENSCLFNLETAYAILLRVSPGDARPEEIKRFQNTQGKLYKILETGKIQSIPVAADNKNLLRTKIRFFYQSDVLDRIVLKQMISEYTESAIEGIYYLCANEHIDFILGLLDEISNKSAALKKPLLIERVDVKLQQETKQETKQGDDETPDADPRQFTHST